MPEMIRTRLAMLALVALAPVALAAPSTRPVEPKDDALTTVMAGEFALQAGQLPDAARWYLDAARRDDDAGLAERATRIALLAKDDARAAEALKLWRARSPRTLALRGAEATLAQATALTDRYKPLVEANAISKQDYTTAVAAQKQAEADLASAKAAVETARINLGYASVTAPISGRIGRALVTEGALVGQGEVTQLATIQQIQPVYVNFTQSASDVMRLRSAMDAGQLKKVSGQDAASVRIVLDDGTEYGQTGKLLFSDLTVDATSGQITLRAEVPNPGGQLLPGLYVRVRLEQAQATDAILVPQQAVTRSDQGDSVMVVDAEGKVAPRKVRIGSAKGTNWVVLEGLKQGEQVMVDGFQKLRGAPKVQPVPWQPDTAKANGAQPAAAPAAEAAKADNK